MDEIESKKLPILIVEDDTGVFEVVSAAIKELGYKIEHSADGMQALGLVQSKDYALIILDLTLPSLGGIEICRSIRDKGKRVPILILSSKREEFDRILGLQIGADDYLTKPFSVRELEARVVALLRRSYGWGQGQKAAPEEIKFRDLVMNQLERSVFLRGERVDLSPIEFDLLYILASEPGRVFSKQLLLELIWDDKSEVYLHLLGPHISRLRTKIETNPSEPQYIRTEWGVGYYFAREP